MTDPRCWGAIGPTTAGRFVRFESRMAWGPTRHNRDSPTIMWGLLYCIADQIDLLYSHKEAFIKFFLGFDGKLMSWQCNLDRTWISPAEANLEAGDSDERFYAIVINSQHRNTTHDRIVYLNISNILELMSWEGSLKWHLMFAICCAISTQFVWLPRW